MGTSLGKWNHHNNQIQRNRSRKIEEQLHRDRMAQVSERKLLLLGAAAAGKSTIIKQMRILHAQGFSETEIHYQKLVIHYNIIQSMATIIQVMPMLGIGFYCKSAEIGAIGWFTDNLCFVFLQKDARLVEGCANENGEVAFTSTVQHALKRLWKDKGIRQTFNRSNEFQLNDSAEYFFNQLDRVGSDSFLPTRQDILHARVPTTGIVELRFKMKGLTIRVVDVGGQRSERKKWIHCFDNVSGIIFVASLSDYDQKLIEDHTANRVQETLRLFGFICNHDLFINTAIMLFLNKKDLFEQKIQRVPLSIAFPDYKGSQDYSESVEFMRKKFRELSKNPSRTLYNHETCATDTDQVKFVLDACFDLIIRQNVLTTGMPD